jgi:hypothetical protein
MSVHPIKSAKNKRVGISKRVRFEVFKRDSFACQYCGRSAPEVILELDHINPVSGGGGNDIMNLVTACEGCNAGKSDRLLDDKSAIAKQKAQLDQLNERREQLEMMLQWREGLSQIDEQQIDAFDSEFAKATGCTLSEHGRGKLKRWLKHHSLAALLEAMDAAMASYFKGGDEDPEENSRIAGEAFGKILSVIRGKEKYANRPYMKDLFYIRGILRNRCYCNDRKAIELLEEAYDAGIHIDDIKQLTLTTTSWTSWHRTLRYWIGGEDE